VKPPDREQQWSMDENTAPNLASTRSVYKALQRVFIWSAMMGSQARDILGHLWVFRQEEPRKPFSCDR